MAMQYCYLTGVVCDCSCACCRGLCHQKTTHAVASAHNRDDTAPCPSGKNILYHLT